MEVDGIREDITIYFYWESTPCSIYDSFGHELGTCSSTPAISERTSTMLNGTSSMEEAVVAPGDTSTPCSHH